MLCYVQVPKPPVVFCIRRSHVLFGKRAISNLRGAASPLNFTAGCAKKPLFKPKESICLKSIYVTANQKKERKI